MKKILSVLMISMFSMTLPVIVQADEGGKKAKPAEKTTPKQSPSQSDKGKVDQNKGKNDKKDDKAWNVRDY